MGETTNTILLSTKLSQLRAEAGLSYQHLSERCCVDVAYLYRLETGKSMRPGRDILIRIGIGLGLDVVSLDELITIAGHWPLLRDLHRKKTVPNDELPSERLAPSYEGAIATDIALSTPA